MKRFLRLACLLLACLMVVGTLTACDITEVLDEMFQDDDHADRDDRYEDDEEEETKKKPSQRPADTEAETDSLERPEETTQWGDTWGEVETTRPQPEDPFKDPFKDPVKDEPLSELDAALKELEGFDFDGRTFGVLCDSSSYYEAYADNESKDGYAAQIINDAVYERNAMLESMLGVDIFVDQVNTGSVATVIKPMVAAGEDAYQMIDCTLTETLALATNGYLLKYGDMNVDLSKSWWDQGTAEFTLAGNVYFMASSSNMWNNDVTYALMFNKDMAARYVSDNLYDVVRNGDWTLTYFNNAIQGAAGDNGDGVWNEYDYYGFVTTYAYANAFFVGADLRYVGSIGADGDFELPVSSNTDLALSVVEMTQQIYHGGATYMAPAGMESLGMDAFLGGRGMFYGEVLLYMKDVLRYSEAHIGVLPLPKYSTYQEEYRSLSHTVGSVLSVPVSAYGGEEVGTIVQAYAVLSHKYVKPAYDNTYIAVVPDEDSMEMLELIWGSHVYDLGLYLGNAGVNELFYTVVNDNSGTFVSLYKSRSRMLEKQVQTILKSLY
ncbi:MAG: hypothetical protein IKU90_00895 [Clostridia bacterium]|nr:hypothetical protein [Clostridia bacterium]